VETNGRWAHATSGLSVHPKQSGQAIVEFALVVPILLVLAFGVLAIGRVVQADMAVRAVAWEAARAGALADSVTQATGQGLATGLAVADDYHLNRSAVQITVDASGYRRGGQVVAKARYVVSFGDLPLLGWASTPLQNVHAEPVDPFRAGVPVGAQP
jgi:Flp pilus assembly protein TadG